MVECVLVLIYFINICACLSGKHVVQPVCVYKRASSLLIPGVRCGGTSCIIDLSLRFAHVAPPGDGVPGG